MIGDDCVGDGWGGDSVKERLFGDCGVGGGNDGCSSAVGFSGGGAGFMLHDTRSTLVS